MKKITVIVIALITFASCKEQQKIGFIDNGGVINNYQMKIDVEDKYKLKDEAFKKKADSIGQAFQIEAQAFQLAANKMSQNKKQEKYQELGQKQQALQQQFQFDQQQIQQAFASEMDSVIGKVKRFVSAYGKDNGYTYILGKNEAGNVMYGKETKDITETITNALNTAYNKKKDNTEKETVKTKE